MGLNINLFVHGVPMGQKIWGPQGDDQRYLSSFYGLPWDIPEAMKIDIMTIGGNTYSYYSLVKGLNVCDSQGRTGSYFALTLRMNAFYGDVQNIYSVLEAAYEKLCVGLCVQESNNVTKYLIADFQNVDARLKEIESLVVNYISAFSVNEDLVSLSGFSANAQTASPNVNLHECTKRVALEYGKQFGTLTVSPYYLSVAAANTVAKYKAETESTKQKAQDEINLQKRLSQEKVDSERKQCQEQARRQVEQAKAENDRKMLELKQSYASIDDKISGYKQTIADKDRQITGLKKQLKQLTKGQYSRNSDVQEPESRGQGRQSDGRLFPNSLSSQGSKDTKTKVLFIIVIVVVVVVVVFAAIRNGKNDEPKKQEKKIERLHTSVPKPSAGNVSDDNITITITQSNCDVEISEVKCGDLYKVVLEGKNLEKLQDCGKWEGNAFSFQGDKSQAKRDSAGKTCKIAYVCNGEEIASKSVKIIE